MPFSRTILNFANKNPFLVSVAWAELTAETFEKVIKTRTN